MLHLVSMLEMTSFQSTVLGLVALLCLASKYKNQKTSIYEAAILDLRLNTSTATAMTMITPTATVCQ